LFDGQQILITIGYGSSAAILPIHSYCSRKSRIAQELYNETDAKLQTMY
jgi:hypothetical protein